MTDKLNDEEIAAIEAAVQAMTPGPWDAEPVTIRRIDEDEGEDEVEINAPNCVESVAVCRTATDNDLPNALGIVALRNSAPRLLADLRAARAEAASKRTAQTEMANRLIAAQEAHVAVSAEVAELRESLSAAMTAGRQHAEGKRAAEAEVARLRAVVEAVRALGLEACDLGDEYITPGHNDYDSRDASRIDEIRAALAPAPEAP
jgi:hypothetical protein